jgi:sn-glycerol 3-phosphate transport system substrate-binding protein
MDPRRHDLRPGEQPDNDAGMRLPSLSRRRVLCRLVGTVGPLLTLAACGGATATTAATAAVSSAVAPTTSAVAPTVSTTSATASVATAATSTVSATSTSRTVTTSAAAASGAAATSATSSAAAVASTSAKPIPPGALRISYWRSLTGPRGAAQDKLAEDFNDSQTAIHVDVTYAGAYDDAAKKFTTAIAGGVAPDCVLLTVDSYMPGFARAGTLLPLDAYAAQRKPIDTSLFIPGLLKNGIVDGKLYQLPLARSTPLLYYNEDALTELGISAPPKTWSEMQSMAPKFVRSNGSGETRWGYDVSPYWWTFASVLWSYGGRFSDDDFNIMLNHPEAVSAANAWSDMVNKDNSAKYASTGTADTDFTSAKSVFLTDSTADLSEWQQQSHFKVGVTGMPAQVASAVPSGGSGLSIVQAAPQQRQEAAWTFMAAMTSQKSSVYFAEQTGYEPTRTDALTDPDMVQYFQKNPEFKVSVDQTVHIHNQDPVTQLPQSINFIQDGLTSIVSKKQSAQDVWRQVSQQLQGLVDTFHQQQKH